MAIVIAHRAGRPASATAAGGRHHARYHGCTAGPRTPRTIRAPASPARPSFGVRHKSTAATAADAARNRSRTAVTTGPRRRGCWSTHARTNPSVVDADSSDDTFDPAETPPIHPQPTPTTTDVAAMTASEITPARAVRAIRAGHRSSRR